MEASVVLSFWALALLLSATPGPDWALVLGHSLGGRGILAPLAGIALGYLGLTTVVAAGLGTVVASHPAVLTLVTVAGALVLVWIGAGMLRSALADTAADTAAGTATPVDESPAEEPTPAGGAVATLEKTRAPVQPATVQLIAQGATVSGLNPKGLLLFIALLPQFVTADSALPVWLQMFALGCLFIVSAVTVYAILGLSARRLLAGSDRGARVLTGVAGAAMVLVAVVMLAQHFLL